MNEKLRYEIKFTLNDIQLAEMESWVSSHSTFSESFPSRVINNLYFDDLEFSSVKDNLSGISKRKKYRLRWYGESKDAAKPVFEIKGRSDRLGFKKSFNIESLNNIVTETNSNDILDLCISSLNKENFFIDQHLAPTLQVVYKRSYYQNHDDIRLTIDNDINFALPLMYQEFNQNILRPYPVKILEIKFDPNKKDLVSSLLQSLHLRPKRHSKYLAGLAVLGMANYV